MLFFSLILKITPLYLNIVLGYIANRFLSISRESIAQLMFFMFAPLVIFNGVFTTDLTRSLLALPIIIFTISTSLCLIVGKIGSHIWQDRTKDLAAFAAGSGNTGYFGLPLALLLLSDQAEGVFILASFGGTLFDNTVGYYRFAKESKPISETLTKLLKLPVIYAFALGLILNLLNVKPISFYTEFMVHIKGAFTVLGMMIIGLGLADLKHFKLDWLFLRLTFFVKFIIWPIIIMGFIALDMAFFHLFDVLVYQALTLISIVPLGVNMAILATLFNAEPDKASSAVLLSTLFALIYVPIFTTIFL